MPRRLRGHGVLGHRSRMTARLVLLSATLLIASCTADPAAEFKNDCMKWLRMAALSRGGVELPARTARAQCECLSEGLDARFTPDERPSAESVVIVGLRRTAGSTLGSFDIADGVSAEKINSGVSALTRECAARL